MLSRVEAQILLIFEDVRLNVATNIGLGVGLVQISSGSLASGGVCLALAALSGIVVFP